MYCVCELFSSQFLLQILKLLTMNITLTWTLCTSAVAAIACCLVYGISCHMLCIILYTLFYLLNTYTARLLRMQPCKLRDWELHVHFKIHGNAHDLYGEGFAIWYTKNKMELGNEFYFVCCRIVLLLSISHIVVLFHFVFLLACI